MVPAPNLTRFQKVKIPLDYLPFCCKPPNLTHAIQKLWCDHTMKTWIHIWTTFPFLYKPPHITPHSLSYGSLLWWTENTPPCTSTSYKSCCDVQLYNQHGNGQWYTSVHQLLPVRMYTVIPNAQFQTLYSLTWNHIVGAIIVYICIHNYCQFKWTQKYPTHHTFL